MAKGYPDYTTFLGRAAGSGDFQYIVSPTIISAGDYDDSSYPEVPQGYQDIFVNLIISCNDDAFIHTVDLIEDVSGATFFSVYFKTNLILDLTGFILEEGQRLRVKVWNNSTQTLGFYYTITFLRRKKS